MAGARTLVRCFWRPPTPVAAASFALCLAVAAAWAGSPRGTPSVWAQLPGGTSAAVMVTPWSAVLTVGRTDDNTAGMEWRSGVFARRVAPSGYGPDLADQPDGGGSVFTHVGLVRADVVVPVARTGPDFAPFTWATYPVRALYLPTWAVVLVSAAVPARWVTIAVGVRRARVRRAAGLCERCGYDVRATATRCPECGASVPRADGTPTADGEAF